MQRLLSLVTIFIHLVVFPAVATAPKEVEFNWLSPSISWEGQTGYAPCLEPFYIKVTNCPTGTSAVTIRLYESDGKKRSAITKAALMGSYDAVARTGGEFSAFISDELSFHRYYYVEVKLLTTRDSQAAATGSSATTLTTPEVITRPSANVTVRTITKTTSTPAPASVPAPAVAASSISETVITTMVQELSEPVYAIPLKSEISKLEFLGSIGAVGFGKSAFQSVDFNLAFVTGLKVKLKPVSTNPNIGRFGLYRFKSRWSAIFGTVINDLSYKSTDIKPAIFGLKPTVGIDFEFGDGAVGLSAGAILGKQDTKSKLTDAQSLVSGFFVGLSFSADVFQSFKRNIPASQNFPSTSGSNQPPTSSSTQP